MSINGKNDGAFETGLSFSPTAHPHDFAGSPVHDRGSGVTQKFFYVSFKTTAFVPSAPNGGDASNILSCALPVGAGGGFGGRWVQRAEAPAGGIPVPFTNNPPPPPPPILSGDSHPFDDYQYWYIMTTCTGLDLITPGIYTVTFNKAWAKSVAQQSIGGTLPMADRMAVYLVAADGARVRLSAPDNLLGYGALPAGILSQVDNGKTWTLRFNSSLVLGSKSFRPQMVFPADCTIGANATPQNADHAFAPATKCWFGQTTFMNFGTVGIPAFYITTQPSPLPAIFSRVTNAADYIGFPGAWAWDAGLDPTWTAQAVMLAG